MVGGKGVQLQTRMGPTKFYHFKTDNSDPSGFAHEILFPMGSHGSIRSKAR